MKKLCIAFFFLFSVLALSEARAESLPVSLSYYGENLLHPGLEAGSDFRMLSAGFYRLELQPHLGFWFHYRNNTTVFVNAVLLNRFYFWDRFSIDLGFGAGYAHAFMNAPVMVYENGGFKDVPDFGSPTAIFPVHLGFSVITNERRDEFFSRFELLLQYPVNATMMYRLAWDIGCLFHIDLGE